MVMAMFGLPVRPRSDCGARRVLEGEVLHVLGEDAEVLGLLLRLGLGRLPPGRCRPCGGVFRHEFPAVSMG